MTETAQTVGKSSTTSNSASARFLALVRGGGKGGFDASGFADVLDQAVTTSLDQAATYADQASSRSSGADKDDTSSSLPSSAPRVQRDTSVQTSNQAQTTTKDQTNGAQDDRPVTKETTEKQVISATPKEKEVVVSDESVVNDDAVAFAATPAAVAAATAVVAGQTQVKTGQKTENHSATTDALTQGKTIDTSSTDTEKSTDAQQTTTKLVATSQETAANTAENTDSGASLTPDDGAEEAAAALLSQMIALRAAQENREAMKASAQKEQEADAASDDQNAANQNNLADVLTDAGRSRSIDVSSKAAAQTGAETSQDSLVQGQTQTGTAPSTSRESGASTSRAAMTASFQGLVGSSGLSQQTTASTMTTHAAAAALAANAASAAVTTGVSSASVGNTAANSHAGTNLLTGVTSASGTTGSIGTMVALKNEQTTASSQSNIVEQVKIQLQKMAKSGDDQMTIHLSPDEMGKIEIKLTFGDDKTVQGTVIADNKVTLEALQKDQSSLQQALQDAGLRADQGCLQFSLRGDGSGSFAQNAFGRPSGQDGSGSKSWNVGVVSGETDSEGEMEETYNLATGRVNLRV